MKKPFILLLQNILRILSRLTIDKYGPGIIGITGNVGKTSTKEAVYAVLRRERLVRKNPANFNNELGLPLAILTNKQKIRWPVSIFWLEVIVFSIIQLIKTNKDYPDVLILEYGADRPGDITKLLRIARPNIAIVTAIGETPVHVEFFAGPKAVAKEKEQLVKAIPQNGFAILNHDDLTVMDMKPSLRGRLITFGFLPGSQIRISNLDYKYSGDAPDGISFKLEYGGSFVPARLKGGLGKGQGYAAAAAAAAGLTFGMNLIKIADALSEYQVPDGRLKFVHGLKQTFILDDSYNASPSSMRLALDTLGSISAKRKIAILGDMLEIGKYAMDAHEAIGEEAARVCDMIITVGPRAKFIADGAIKKGFNKKKIIRYDRVEDALASVHSHLEEGDLILVKASRAIHLEKIVSEIKNPVDG